jgi:P-type Ca2+ transporter type 2C
MQSITSTYSLLSSYETAKRLKSSLTHGLSIAQASAIRLEEGPNELPQQEQDPLWKRFLKQFQETLILLLLASAVVSFLMGNLSDAISITLAVSIVVTVAFVQEYRSEQSLQALNRLVPHNAHLLRGKDLAAPNGTISPQPGLESEAITESLLLEAEQTSHAVQASTLVPGDLVTFSTGDRIPADIRITRAIDLTIDQSALTGENEPVRNTTEALSPQNQISELNRPGSPFYASPAAGTVGTSVDLNDRTNIAFMGTLVRSGHGQGIVVATGGKTEFGAISASLAEIESPRTPLQIAMDQLGKQLSYMSFGVIGLIVVVGLLQGRDWLDMFTIGVSLAVAAIPEGLPIIVSVTLALGVIRMSKSGGIVRKLPSVETLGCVNVVCSDKTGKQSSIRGNALQDPWLCS